MSEVTKALTALGLPPPPVQVRIALRRWYWSKGANTPIGLMRASAVVAFLTLYAQLCYWLTVFVTRLFHAPKQHENADVPGIDNMPWTPFLYAAVIGLTFFFVTATVQAAFILYIGIPYESARLLWKVVPHRRMRAVVARETALIGRIASAVVAADRIRRQGSRNIPRNAGRLVTCLKAVKRQVASSHQAAGVPVFSSRARRLREHQNLVVAAIQRAETQLDVAPIASLTSLSTLLMKIADGYTRGQRGALLPPEDLQDLQPVRDWEPVRMVITALFIAGAAVAIAVLNLPDSATTALVGASGVLGASLVYGRGARSALDVAGFVQGR
ncbi:hypothetical protein [Streptomyces spiralis]|nr:hypothetical protein [Streptomyces spiralis]